MAHRNRPNSGHQNYGRQGFGLRTGTFGYWAHTAPSMLDIDWIVEQGIAALVLAVELALDLRAHHISY